MKKSLALTSASVLGVGLAAVAAAPAQAADVTTPCAGSVNHAATVGALNDNWFMDCVPQYGVGKVEFTISADEPFPTGFATLFSNGPTATSTGVTGTFSGDHDAVKTYFAEPSWSPAGFSQDFLSDGHPGYSGNMFLKIAGVQSIDPATLPAECNADTVTYEHAYRLDYEPSTVTYTQTIDGEAWEFRVTFAPQPRLYGVNFGGPDPQTSTGVLDALDAQCLVLNNVTYFAADWESNPEAFDSIVNRMGSTSPFSGTTFVNSLGDFPRYIEPAGEPEPEPQPGLADTGAEISPVLLGAGAVALLGGAGLFAASRARTTRRSNA